MRYGKIYLPSPIPPAPSDSKRDFPWSIDVAMDGHDLIVKEATTREKHSYNIAPTDGYQKSYHFESSKDPDAWKDGIENEFFSSPRLVITQKLL